jgi:hypothetical protein
MSAYSAVFLVERNSFSPKIEKLFLTIGFDMSAADVRQSDTFFETRSSLSLHDLSRHPHD